MLSVVNWRDDVSAVDCFIEFRGIFYNITRVDMFEGYKQGLKVFAARLASQPGAGDVGVWGGWIFFQFCYCDF